MNAAPWLGIAFCASQSALFSGLNIAVFGISRLRLETEASTGRPEAKVLLALRKDANFLLTTILWGNVGINVLLALLSNSVMTGVYAFLFSTIVITFLGEIIPQAYFVRNALRMVSRMAPLLRFYQILLYPVAKPSAKMLDWMLGPEGIEYFREEDLGALLRRHGSELESEEVSHIEGIGAANFLLLDDVPVSQEGELVDELSVLELPFAHGRPVFPAFEADAADPFLRVVQRSGHKWVVLTDETGEPRMVMDADGFLRGVLFDPAPFYPLTYCHRPLLTRDPEESIGHFLPRFRVLQYEPDHDVVHHDIVLLWADERRVITGADILGRLLRGIAKVESVSPARS